MSQPTNLTAYTKGQISDGGGEDFTLQDFAEVRTNQAANPNIDCSNQWGQYADYSIIQLDNSKNDFVFYLKK